MRWFDRLEAVFVWLLIGFIALVELQMLLTLGLAISEMLQGVREVRALGLAAGIALFIAFGLGCRLLLKRLTDGGLSNRGELRDPGSACGIGRVPGSKLLRLAEFVFSAKTLHAVVAPTLRDLQDEYFEALHQGRPGKARWVLVRGYWSFWSAVVAQVPVSLTRLIVQLWKISGPGG